MKESEANCEKGVAIFEGFEHIQNGVQQNTFGNIFLNWKVLKNFGAKTIYLISLGVFRHLSFEEGQHIPPTVPSLALIFSRMCWTYSIKKFLLHDIYVSRTHKSEKNIYFSGEIEMTGIKRKRKLSDLNSSEDGFQRMARMMRMDFKGGRAWYLITGLEHLNQGNLL